jgi:glycosyltransferase involved in cell wall biosynthesis
MKFFPLISIVMNCHNGDKYLKKSVGSLIKQTYKNWELIFWDNKSTDKSNQIIKNIKDKRIKYFKSQKFYSLYKARNLAIKKAKGKFLCFLDTDDWWLPTKLKRQVEVFKKKNKLSFLYSNFYQFNENLKKKYIFHNTKLPKGFITQDLLDDYKIGILTVMMKKKLFEKFKFNEKYNIIGDFDLFTRISIKNKIDCLQKPLAFYRFHNNNYTKKNLSIYNNELKIWFGTSGKKFYKLNYSIKNLKKIFFKNKIKIFLNYFNFNLPGT